MPDDLMTTRELQELLRLDRTTIYHMLGEGELPGFKVGGQWRFSRREIEAWLRQNRPAEEKPPPVRPSPDILPVGCIQSLQAILAEAMAVGSIVTRLDGTPLTQISNSCAYCNLILDTPRGFQRCMGSWRALSAQAERRPHLQRCHAGLLYARGRIEVEEEFVAMVFAGQVVLENDLSEAAARLEELAADCRLDPAALRQALPSIRSVALPRSERLMRLLEHTADTLSEIGRERLVLLRKLEHIAEVVAL